MPVSWSIFDGEAESILTRLLAFRPAMRVLDIGCGAGKYGQMIRRLAPDARLHGYEVYMPYIEQYELRKFYSSVHNLEAKAANMDMTGTWDMCIFGDVLEHMPKSQGVDLIHFLLYRTKFLMMMVPYGYVQGPVGGVKSEAHVSSWSAVEFLPYTRLTYQIATDEQDKNLGFMALLKGFLSTDEEWTIMLGEKKDVPSVD